MKTPPRALLLGLLVAAGLTVVALLGAAWQNWVLVVGAGMALMSACLVVAVDVDRRVRALRRQVRTVAPVRVRGPQRRAAHQSTVGVGAQGPDHRSATGDARPVSGPLEPVPVTAPDVLGAVRVLQAQYVGRLDRLQRSLEQALLTLEERSPVDTMGHRPPPEAND